MHRVKRPRREDAATTVLMPTSHEDAAYAKRRKVERPRTPMARPLTPPHRARPVAAWVATNWQSTHRRNRQRAILLSLMLCGLRRIEVATLNTTDLDANGRTTRPHGETRHQPPPATREPTRKRDPPRVGRRAANRQHHRNNRRTGHTNIDGIKRLQQPIHSVTPPRCVHTRRHATSTP